MLRSVALVLGGLICVGIETWGAGEFMWEKYGHWNYLVVGGIAVTALTGLLPVAGEHAHQNGAPALKWASWLTAPLALAFVFTVSIQRTGSATDTDEAARQQTSVAIQISKKEEREAEDQLIRDKATVAKICEVWGPKCSQAKADQAATEAKLAGARGVLKKHGVASDDSLARRLTAILPFLTKEQVQLYQPLLLPMTVSIMGTILIAVGLRRKKKPQEKLQEKPPAKEEPKVEVVPEPAPMPKAAARPRPRLVVAQEGPLAGLVFELMKVALEPAKGSSIDLVDCYARYKADSSAQGREPLTPNDYKRAMDTFCKGLGIRTRFDADANRKLLLGVRLVANKQHVTHAT
jgi:hypothetical protein